MSGQAADTDVRDVNEQEVKTAVGAAGMGNALEWFDFGVYSYMAGTIGQVFFPSSSTSGSLLASFAAFAVAFLARPFGSFIFGPLGDKFGRCAVLIITILMMSGATFVVGLLPSYQTIGVWAPILLVVARLVQGFSTGGEYGGAATFMCEYSPDDRRGFLASFLEFGTLAGYTAGAVLVTGVRLGIGDDAFSDWGWRIPFLVALPFGLVGVYMRLKLGECPAFEDVDEDDRMGMLEGIKTAFGSNLRLTALCIGLVILLNVAYYTVLTYLPSYMTDVLNMSSLHSLVFLIAIMIVMMCVIGFVGKASDRLGRRPVLLASAIGFIVLSYPAFWLLSLGSMTTTIIGLAILGALTVLLSGTMPSTLPAIFPTRSRYSGFAISYNVSTSLFGGTAPYIITLLISVTGSKLVPAYYLMAAAAIAIVPILLITETANKPLSGSKAQRTASKSDGGAPPASGKPATAST